MASLLNMLNNFLGSTGKSSLFNVDSSNTTQSTEFKDIVLNFLNNAEVDQQTVSGLLLGPTGGVDLPLPAATGNGLPPLLATAAVGIDASLQLPDAEAVPLATLGSNATRESVAIPLDEDGELLALQTPAAVPASTHAVTQQTPPVSALELPLTPVLETPINTAPQSPLLDGADVQANGSQTPAINNTLATGLTVPDADPIVRVAEVDANAKRPVKLDSIPQGAEQSAINTLNSRLPPANATSLEPAPAVSVPASSAIELPLPTPQAVTALPVDARPQVAAANDAIIPGNSSTNVSTTVPAAQTPSHSGAQVVDLNSTAPAPITTKDPQQLLVEQALGNTTTSDNDAPAEVTRQSVLPTSPPLRPASTVPAPLQTTDASFANVANMFNLGQSMSSLNERLQFMLLNGQNSAEIQLDPPELGSLQVRVTTRHEQTSVIFVAPNNIVRDALEQQLPRLRETLESAGLQLQDANVFAQSDDKAGTQPQSYADVEATDSLLAGELDDDDGGVTAARVSMRLIDAYI
ncbi:MAG: flagellar hook-length control protein FliK [Pseudomonadales bacterium]